MNRPLTGPASCISCLLANINGPLHCSECESDKKFGLAPDEPAHIEVTLLGRATVARVERFRMTYDGRLLPTEEPQMPPTVENLRARGKLPNAAAAHGPRNIGMEDEPQEYEASPYDGTYSED